MGNRGMTEINIITENKHLSSGYRWIYSVFKLNCSIHILIFKNKRTVYFVLFRPLALRISGFFDYIRFFLFWSKWVFLVLNDLSHVFLLHFWSLEGVIHYRRFFFHIRRNALLACGLCSALKWTREWISEGILKQNSRKNAMKWCGKKNCIWSN